MELSPPFGAPPEHELVFFVFFFCCYFVMSRCTVIKIQLARSARATRFGGAGYREKCGNIVDPVMRSHSPAKRTRVQAWCSFTDKSAIFAFRLSPLKCIRARKTSAKRLLWECKRKKKYMCNKSPKKGGKKMKTTLFTSYPPNSIQKNYTLDSSFSPLQSANHELGSESDLSLRLNCP